MRLLAKLRTWGKFATAGTSSAAHPTGDGLPKLIFVSHEASRTGAPLILLHLLRHFQQNLAADYAVLLHAGGVLHGDFARICPTECLDLPRQPSAVLARRISQWLISSRLTQGPVMALCNSMESRYITQQLHAHQIPVISLVHELPTSYTDDDYQLVFSASEKVVFPAQCVRAATECKSAYSSAKGLVIPQGLLNPSFGQLINRQHARQAIRHELNLPADAHIVLGCGTLDMRKGIDHFAQVAIAATNNLTSLCTLHFVWIGDGPRWPHSAYHYVQLDLDKHGIQRRVHFIGERDDVQPYFLAADAFLMSSRVDPFPCVIHEAMAAELPIITFDQNGGAHEAIAHGAGIVVPYGDYQAAAQAIERLATDSGYRSRLVQTAKQRVDTIYRFDHYGDQVLALARSLLSPPALRAA